MSVIVAGLASLKSTFIIPSVVIISFIFILFVFSRNSNKVRQIFIFAMIPILSFILLLPWMICNYKSNGTMLYPIFGRGYHGSIYGNWENSFENFSILGTIRWFPAILSNSFIILITILLLIVIFRKDVSFKMFWLPLISYVTLLCTVVIIITQTEGYGWDRYSWPYSVSIFLFLLVIVLQKEYHPFGLNIMIKSIVVITVAMNIFGSNGNKLATYLHDQLTTIKNIDKNMYIEEVNRETKYNVIDKSEYLRYKKMQYIVPINEIILTRLRYPFLLDFSRNVIFIADYPGGSSPPHGMPAFQGSIKLANYLNNNNIRYVAYSYKSEANFKFEDLKGRLSGGSLIRTEAKHTFDFQKNLSELGNTYKKIYDDGEIFVLDLNKPLKTD